MGDQSAIEWTDATWNPTVGCSIVSPGCTNCYAMKMAARVAAMGGKAGAKYAGLTMPSKAGAVWNGTVRLDADALLQPLRWKKPRRIFVNSMSDLFHEDLPDAAIDKVFAVMALAPQHTFQVLTKRAKRMRSWFARERLRTAPTECLGELYVDHLEVARDWPLTAERATGVGLRGWPLPNVWLGVSAEDQVRYNERVPELQSTPAVVRFVSIEPLLGPIELAEVEGSGLLDWIIVGGESGPGARPMRPDWARAIRDRCASADVAFFFKQWGDWAPFVGHPLSQDRALSSRGFETVRFMDDTVLGRVGKAAAGRTLDGRTHDAFPARP